MVDFCPPLNPQVPLRSIAQELIAVFEEAGFNTHGIAAHLGPQATEALYRGEPAAVEVATTKGSQMDLLIRLFLLHQPAPATELAEAVRFLPQSLSMPTWLLLIKWRSAHRFRHPFISSTAPAVGYFLTLMPRLLIMFPAQTMF